MKKIFFFITVLVSTMNLSGQNPACQESSNFDMLDEAQFITLTDALIAEKEQFWEYKKEMEKQGLTVCPSSGPEITFLENCDMTTNLDQAYLAIRVMNNNNELRIRIVGNCDAIEVNSNPSVSLHRAEFISSLFIKYGIEPDRIEIFDAKNDRPMGPNTENGREYNRYVDLEVIAGK